MSKPTAWSEPVSSSSDYRHLQTSPLAPFLPHLCALVVTLLALALVPDPGWSAAAIGLTSAVFAVIVTLNRGGAYLPPSSVYVLASGVFIGAGVYYLLIVDTLVPIDLIRDAAALALLSTIGVTVVIRLLSDRWRLRWPTVDERTAGRRRPVPPPNLPMTGLVLMIVSRLPPVQAFVGDTTYSIGLAGVILVVVWASSRWGQMQWFGDLFIVALVFVLPWFWVQMTFSGGGRLLIAGVSVAAFVIWNVFNPSRAQKVILILCIPIFLTLAGLDRASGRAGETTGSVVISQGEGLGSVYAPLETFARVIGPLEREQRQMLGPRFGETFLNTFYLPIPRKVWPGKPEGFGAELTRALEPKLVRARHSMAALNQGEWYANFGYGGLVLMVPAMGWFLAWLDRRHARSVAADYRDDRWWWRLAITGCIVSSLADLCWVGSFMLYARGGLAALVVFLASRFVIGRRHLPAIVPTPPAGDGRGGGRPTRPRTSSQPSVRSSAEPS